MNSDHLFALLLITFFGGILPLVLAIGIPLGKAWVRRMERRAEAMDDGAREELQRLAGRVAELEERLDFTERLLSQQRQVGQIGE